MTTDLHVLANGVLLETFHLEPGLHFLGSGPTADLVLARKDAPDEVCRVELGLDGLVMLRSTDDQPLSGSSGSRQLELVLSHGDYAEARGLRLLHLTLQDSKDVVVDLPKSDVPTAPSTGVRPPLRELLALKITAGGKTQIVEVEGPSLTFGRGPGNAVSFIHGEVSRRHARLFRKADGPWIEDLGSQHGTFLNGVRVKSAQWPLTGRVLLSAAVDAPAVELVPLTDALSEIGVDVHLQPLRGRSPLLQQVRAQVLRYGTSEDAVLLLGENGTGKDVAARALAGLRGGVYQVVNCGAMPDTLIEAALFGTVKGAYTGAVDRAGACEAAGGGTIFLDEIGELSLTSQARLLRLLEAREFSRVGETRVRPLKARVVAATNRDLDAMVRAGTFREDLFHRLNVLVIKMPPLRAHPDDIPELARIFLRDRAGKSSGKVLSEAALEKLVRYEWRGNVRELRNTLHRAAANWDGAEIPPEAIVFTETAAGSAPAPTTRKELGNLPAQLNAIERALCERALAENTSVVKAAASVGMATTTFRRCLERHGLLPTKPEDEAA